MLSYTSRPLASRILPARPVQHHAQVDGPAKAPGHYVALEAEHTLGIRPLEAYHYFAAKALLKCKHLFCLTKRCAYGLFAQHVRAVLHGDAGLFKVELYGRCDYAQVASVLGEELGYVVIHAHARILKLLIHGALFGAGVGGRNELKGQRISARREQGGYVVGGISSYSGQKYSGSGHNKVLLSKSFI